MGDDRSMGCGPAPARHRWLFGDSKTPPSPPLLGQFFTVGADLRRTRPTRGWLRLSQQMDVYHRQLVGGRLKDCPVVIGLHELSPVGQRHQKPAITHPAPPSPLAFAHDLASKSSLACSIPSTLRWHSKINSFKTLTPASKSACLIPSACPGSNS